MFYKEIHIDISSKNNVDSDGVNIDRIARIGRINHQKGRRRIIIWIDTLPLEFYCCLLRYIPT